MEKDLRRSPRMIVNIPVEAQVGASGVQVLSVTDISATGMQIQSQDFETLKAGFDTTQNQAHFELHIDARMAWVQNDGDGSFVTGWEFSFGRSDAERGVKLSVESDGKRRHERLNLDLPIQAQVGQGKLADLELVDISPSGMQLRCSDFDVIKDGLDSHSNRAQFRILLDARLAWVQTAENNDFVTGWEFGAQIDDSRIG